MPACRHPTGKAGAPVVYPGFAPSASPAALEIGTLLRRSRRGKDTGVPDGFVVVVVVVVVERIHCPITTTTTTTTTKNHPKIKTVPYCFTLSWINTSIDACHLPTGYEAREGWPQGFR
jgi:hypothetical protein